MNSVEQYVNQLFAGYKKTKQTNELKEEMISNLHAKIADLTSGGMDDEQAFKIATAHIQSIEGLIDDNLSVYIFPFWKELVQISLLYSLIAWILTIPIGIVRPLGSLSYVLPFIALLLGIIYWLLNARGLDKHKTASFRTLSVQRVAKFAWLIWGGYILISMLSTTALRMGSNIWYARPLHLAGPYQYADLAADYVQPFFTIVIPLLFSAALKLIYKYEAGETLED